jgi:hypothetical protein
MHDYNGRGERDTQRQNRYFGDSMRESMRRNLPRLAEQTINRNTGCAALDCDGTLN